jgi:hypothetical protein
MEAKSNILMIEVTYTPNGALNWEYASISPPCVHHTSSAGVSTMPKRKLSHLINLGSYNKYKGIPSYKKSKQNDKENVSFIEWERSG